VSPVDRERLRSLLDGPATRRLVDALQRRLERGVSGDVLTLPHPDPEERRAVEALLGRRPGRGQGLSVSVAALEAVLVNAGIAPDLASAVAALRGPLRDRRGERERAAARWARVYAEVQDRAHGLGLTPWLEELRATGLPKRLAGNDPEGAAALLAQALDVAERLPAPGIALSRLAAEAVGDAHALDAGRPLATLVRRACTHLAETVGGEGEEGEREAWAAVGVLVGGAVTSSVLCLNLRATGGGVSDRMLNALAEAGQPGYLTLRQLVREPPVLAVAGTRVHVCENPAVVAEAADRLGPGCKPLVCTQGQPGAAVATALRLLHTAGAELAYHGDFDWPGLTIAAGVIQRLGAHPWRFATADYRAAPATGKPLAGTPVPAPWDPALTEAMQVRGEAVEEECVLEDLIGDLRS
jgi:uncharacterized protein (TIGR02679 family)